jgi:DNA end-binding protein Ku
MRSVWNGTITFGLVAIPVKAYSATEERGTGLHQFHATDGGRIRLRRTCEIDGADVPFAELASGFELPDGDVVMLTQEDMAGLPATTAHAIEVRSFTPLERIDPLYYHRGYFLAPEPAGAKPYVLLAEALRETGKVAVATVALRQRETLAMLRERDGVLILTTLLWPDEVRTPDFPFLDENVPVATKELSSAVADVTRLSEDFRPERYADRYQAALRDLVAARVATGKVVRPTAAEQDAAAATLVTALKESADQAATARAVARAKAAARKAAAAKAAATRAANRARSRGRAGNPAGR